VTGENRSTRVKTCPNASLSTTNPTWTDHGSNPGLCGGRPTANRLTQGWTCAVVIQYTEKRGGSQSNITCAEEVPARHAAWRNHTHLQ
jgi:hypothetical protein